MLPLIVVVPPDRLSVAVAVVLAPALAIVIAVPAVAPMETVPPVMLMVALAWLVAVEVCPICRMPLPIVTVPPPRLTVLLTSGTPASGVPVLTDIVRLVMSRVPVSKEKTLVSVSPRVDCVPMETAPNSRSAV